MAAIAKHLCASIIFHHSHAACVCGLSLDGILLNANVGFDLVAQSPAMLLKRLTLNLCWFDPLSALTSWTLAFAIAFASASAILQCCISPCLLSLLQKNLHSIDNDTPNARKMLCWQRLWLEEINQACWN